MMRAQALLVVLLTTVPFAAAQAGTPLRPLLQDQARATDFAAHAAVERAAHHQAVHDRTVDIITAKALLRKARAGTGANDKAVAAAMDSLARAKAGYDAARDHERVAVIMSVQADAGVRAARQAVMDAVTGWTAEGEALERAAARASSGELAPTARENTACLDQDCSPIPPAEHSALVLMGAVGSVFDPKDWPAEAAQQMTLLPAAGASAFTVRSLREAATQAAKQVQTTAVALNTARAAFENVRPAWEAAVKNLLDAYFHPADHSAPPAPAAVDDVIATSDTTAAAEQSERAASSAVDAAKASQPAIDARLSAAVTLFGDQGRATQRAARLAGRGYLLTASPAGLAICRDKLCESTGGLEAAAFLVVGAAASGTEKSLDAFVAPAADKRWVFRLPNLSDR